MGRTACTEPQCLYKGALYLYFYFATFLDTLNFYYIFFKSYFDDNGKQLLLIYFASMK